MRTLSWIFLILTVIVVVLDWMARGEDGAMVLRPLAVVWDGLHGASLAEVTPSESDTGLHWDIWRALLAFPAALSFGIAFLFCRIIGSMTRRDVNDDPFVNRL